MSTRVLVVDDHRIACDILIALLEEKPGMQVLGAAGSGEDALVLVRSLHPDLVLMDIGLPGMDGIEATRKIRAEFPKTQVIFVSMHSEPECIIKAREVGALGYILKSEPPSRLVGCIDKMLNQ